MDKQTARAVISQLLSKALVAVIKLIRTKVLPQVMNRYCKTLQKTAEKLTGKANALIDKVPKIKDTKKLVRTLYVLRLIQEATATVGKALTTLSETIETHVDFTLIDNPENDDIASEVATLEVLANADTEGGCGPDGCEIV